jgi:hypothetical protein
LVIIWSTSRDNFFLQSVQSSLFRSLCTILEDYDLNVLTIYYIALDWEPFATFKDCNSVGKECSSSGYLIDYINILSKELNFTYEAHSDPDSDWGVLPKSGPNNHSGIWGGVVGGLVNNKYDLSLSAWNWIIDR